MSQEISLSDVAYSDVPYIKINFKVLAERSVLLFSLHYCLVCQTASSDLDWSFSYLSSQNFGLTNMPAQKYESMLLEQNLHSIVRASC